MAGPQVRAGSPVVSAFQVHLPCTQSQFINPTNTGILEDVFLVQCILSDKALHCSPLTPSLCLQGHQGTWYRVGAQQVLIGNLGFGRDCSAGQTASLELLRYPGVLRLAINEF